MLYVNSLLDRLRDLWSVRNPMQWDITYAPREPEMSTVERTYCAKVAAIHKLRVNVKSLAEEARIIRQEAKRCGREYRAVLDCHRRGRVRDEARIAQLALAYVRGMPYRRVESKAHVMPDVRRLVEKIGRNWKADSVSVEKWLKT